MHRHFPQDCYLGEWIIDDVEMKNLIAFFHPQDCLLKGNSKLVTYSDE